MTQRELSDNLNSEIQIVKAGLHQLDTEQGFKRSYNPPEPHFQPSPQQPQQPQHDECDQCDQHDPRRESGSFVLESVDVETVHTHTTTQSTRTCVAPNSQSTLLAHTAHGTAHAVLNATIRRESSPLPDLPKPPKPPEPRVPQTQTQAQTLEAGGLPEAQTHAPTSPRLAQPPPIPRVRSSAVQNLVHGHEPAVQMQRGLGNPHRLGLGGPSNSTPLYARPRPSQLGRAEVGRVEVGHRGDATSLATGLHSAYWHRHGISGPAGGSGLPGTTTTTATSSVHVLARRLDNYKSYGFGDGPSLAINPIPAARRVVAATTTTTPHRNSPGANTRRRLIQDLMVR